MSEMPDALSPLRGHPIWVAWNNEKGRKVPKSPHVGNARSNDPSTWGTYDEASEAARSNGYSGVGIMLTDGLVGIDLDGAIDDAGKVKPWAQEILDAVGSYAEISPSGAGIHIIAHADLDKVGAIGRADHRAGVEAYNHGRYFTVTGEQIGDGSVSDKTEEIAEFVAKRFAGKSVESRIRDSVKNLAKDQVQRRANQTMEHNAKRDKVRYARVATGGETCTFCAMLSSRGFVYASAKEAGKGGHYHRGCRCKVVPGFDGMEVEGYDPAEMAARWREFEEIDAMSDANGNPLPDFDKRALKTAYTHEGIDYGKVLKAVESHAIPAAKLEKYALDPERQPDKARAFKGRLGYTKDDAATVAARIYEHVADHEPEFKETDRYGDRFTTRMVMDGKDGRSAKVKAGWIRDTGGGKMRMTSVYVNE